MKTKEEEEGEIFWERKEKSLTSRSLLVFSSSLRDCSPTVERSSPAGAGWKW